ncbi:hypothetical protein [Cryobacterium luteum]|uniref:Uncharacterized protein n=1 Tax=Cryobacterium luteum TaxID=1424661 RepID=A0A1H8AXV2_9MICO|nr:hypothetical protein [Cryobacterium luteum]TFB88669.1 hypothetical protein E3O10_12945 [Cryobacterium luteum]SEM75326.1 hypothetical protein SAMN05216281_101373 [Cryobacterium luteum]
MTSNYTSTAFGSPARKRIAVGAVTVMTVGSLLGLGVAGANATPLTADNTSSTSSHAGHDVLASLTKELRADLQGASNAETTKQVSDTLASHPDLFETLPANLQADLTALNAATADQSAATAAQTAAADKIEITALEGGYGVDIQKLAEEIQKDPAHPLAAALRGLLAVDAEQGTDAASAAEKIATTISENPALLAQLPEALTADLAEQQALPAAEQAAAAEALLVSALEGGYGPEVQKVTEQIQSSLDAKASAEGTADATASAEGADTDTDTDLKVDGEVKADN